MATVSVESARWLLRATDGMTVRLDSPHVLEAATAAVRARSELQAIIDSESDDEN